MFERELTPDDFDAFFQELWGKTPFPWQTALARRLLESEPCLSPNPTPGSLGEWPQAITLPTASGKTACLDIAVFILASQAGRQTKVEVFTAPRRIFFVVDRRVIVDEAFKRSQKLAKKLAEAKDGILKDVADRLRQLAGGENQPPLACFQLRGGIYRDDAWAKSPIQPTIVCSTVDQTGSRLLFRAYGRSFKAWSLQAGLVGNDSLILLDEAHCAQPFMETLNAVAKYRQWAEMPLASPFRLVVMTATPPAGVSRFPDSDTEQANLVHPVLKKRFEAVKPCRLEVAGGAQGKDVCKINQALAEKLVVEAETLVKAFNGPTGLGDLFAQGGQPALAIFCNRVDTARRTYGLLADKYGGNAVLLTGRMRSLDKDDTVAGPLAVLDANNSDQRKLEAPLFIVATQTLEVGANLDFDLMVSECADLSALRQRFGRLNRMGRPIKAQGVIVIRADQEKEGSDLDPVYGLALAATWGWLNEQKDSCDLVDMGIAGLSARLPENLLPYTVQSLHAPVMLPAHVDALAQTAPVPCPSPDVALFLHGPQSGPADVQVCWRADLDASQNFGPNETREAAWIEAVALCPPATGELMPVPFAAFHRWLADESNTADGGDVEGTEAEDETADSKCSRLVLRWLGREDSEVVADMKDIHPGDVVVIPSGLKGWETFGHIPTGTLIDQGDHANRNARAIALLRLTPGTLGDWPDTPARQRLQDLLGDADSRLDQEADALDEDVKDALFVLSEETVIPAWIREIASRLAKARRPDRCLTLHPCGGGLVVKGTRRLPARPDTDFGFSHEDDATASGTVRVPLSSHLEGVAEFARLFTRHLPQAIAEDVQLAALCHDLGKADPRFQALLHGGNPWGKGALLAKSGDMPQGRAAFERARKSAGYPQGGRHELLSVRLLESTPDLLAQAHDPDLVLHLIASHHGHCRPFAPVVGDPDTGLQPVSLEFHGHTLSHPKRTGLERLDSGIAERYWRLIRRYGWWGLAGLESTLMLSDHRRSEWEQLNEEKNHV